ncbi:energy-coupling factor transporter ATPase [Bacillus sp. FJAT-45350]|uniref:energy-coupling factor transporter ATPase n=1 Tax=Bacillus sp. FJAT-45350 TaxID=2011014 RepID=UPI0027BA0EAF|nr:energy-coupling factor transporter ATPase [Bacillus sp. FJAT-45350]
MSIKNLSYSYNADAEQMALRNVDLSIHGGEWVAIIGHNGSGKSTLSRFLNALFIPTVGEVIVEGFSSKDENSIWEIRRRVGLVFQNPDNQLVATTVRDDIAFGLENNGIPQVEMEDRIVKSLEKVHMEKFIDHEPHRLSGGQKQRIAIAGILAIEPKIMVFDEATSMLDPIGRREVIETVRQLNKIDGKTIISITHDLNEASFADRIVVMNQGEVVLQGTPKEVFSKEEVLKGYSLDIPFAIQMRQRLLQAGLSFVGEAITEDELVDELWKLKLKS